MSIINVDSIGENLHLPNNTRLPGQPGAGPQPLRGPAVFLDRDGVLLEDVHFLTDSKDLRVLPGVAEALQLLRQRFLLVVVTNQSAIARGLLTEDTMVEIHQALVSRLAQSGAGLDGIYYCPHLPDAHIDHYRVDCDCRKPRPGLLLRAASDWGIDLSRSFLVGDMPRDIQAGDAAGVSSILLGNSVEAPTGKTPTARDLLEAARLILDSNDSPDPILTAANDAPGPQSLPSRL